MGEAPTQGAHCGRLFFFGYDDGAREEGGLQRLGALFAELHRGLSLASASAGAERAGWHLHLH